jgi:hypothetical protein
MSNTTSSLVPIASLPGTTASGIASAGQLVEFTPTIALQVDATAARGELIVLAPIHAYHETKEPPTLVHTALRAEEYPVLAEIWDNKEDDIFDTV